MDNTPAPPDLSGVLRTLFCPLRSLFQSFYCFDPSGVQLWILSLIHFRSCCCCRLRFRFGPAIRYSVTTQQLHFGVSSWIIPPSCRPHFRRTLIGLFYAIRLSPAPLTTPMPSGLCSERMELHSASRRPTPSPEASRRSARRSRHGPSSQPHRLSPWIGACPA